MDGKITRDWSTEFKALYTQSTAPEEPKRIANTNPSLAIDKMLGTYKHLQYGTVEITKTKKGIQFNLNNTVIGSLSHWHFDTYQIDFDLKMYGKAMVNFILNAEAEIIYIEVFGERFDIIRP
jgi:hypothetical protein